MTRGLGGAPPSDIASHLKGIGLPCGKKDRLAHVMRGDADPAVLHKLAAMPKRQYLTMAEAAAAPRRGPRRGARPHASGLPPVTS